MQAGISVDKSWILYGYEKCENSEGDLIGLSLILSSVDQKDRVSLDVIGRPEDLEGQDCPGYIFPSQRIYKAAIYADENRVYGVKFLSVISESTLGSTKGTPTLVDFGPKTIPVGFYGTYGPDGLTSLGFLSHDPACIAVMPPPEPEPEPEVVNRRRRRRRKKEDSGGAGIAVAIIIPLLLIGLGVAGYLWWRRRKRELGAVTQEEPEFIPEEEDPPHMRFDAPKPKPKPTVELAPRALSPTLDAQGGSPGQTDDEREAKNASTRGLIK